jgi:hypothetical protein
MEFFVFKKSTAAEASVAKSAVVAVLYSPVEAPKPLSSYRNTAIPRLEK